MRPDAISWQNARELTALEFTPRKLTYHKMSRWFAFALAAQALATILIWLVVHGALLHTAPPDQAAQQQQDAATAASTLHAALLRTIVSVPFILLVGAALVAAAAVELVFLVRIRIILKRQTRGLTSLFQGIRDLASGVLPKPLPAGLAGEVGYLTLAFNDMVGRVAASKQALIEANQLLERRVEERTSELRDALQKMERMATTDALTGLYNRRCLTHEFREAFEDARDRDHELVCIAIDLDGFKGVNDVLGHQTGDEIIRLAADCLRNHCRAQDLAARLGGDEFLVLLTRMEMAEALLVAQRLAAEFHQRAGEMLQGRGLQRTPSMSIGVSSRQSGRPATLEELISQADTALYDAKERGKARVETFVRQAA